MASQPNALTAAEVCRQLGVPSLYHIIPSPVRFEKGSAWRYLIRRSWAHAKIEDENRSRFDDADVQRPKKWRFPVSSEETKAQDLAFFLGFAGGNPNMAPTGPPGVIEGFPGQHQPSTMAYKFVPGLYADCYADAWELEDSPMVEATFLIAFKALFDRHTDSVPGEIWLFQDHTLPIFYRSAETFVRTLNPAYRLPAVEYPKDDDTEDMVSD